MRHGQYRDEDSKRDPERDTTSATSPRGVARAPRWPNSPDLAGNAPLRRRLSRASPAARRCHRRRSIEQVYSRFARARDARNLPWSLTSDPPFPTATAATCCSPRATRIFARDPARANRPLDPHATTPRTRSRLRPRLHFAPTQIPIRRASRDRGRARRARDAVPSHSPRRKPSESGYDATGRCRANCSVKSEPGRRALETLREVSRDVRLSESSKTIQALMCGARRARLCAAIAAAATRRASSFRKSAAWLLPHLRRSRCCRIHNS